MKARAVAVTIGLVVLGLSGCSGSGTGASNESLPDPCALGATTDLDAITGAVWTQQPPPEAGGPICDWTASAPPGLTKAFATADGGLVGMKVGDWYVQVDYSSQPAAPDPGAITRQLAEKAATRLKAAG